MVYGSLQVRSHLLKVLSVTSTDLVSIALKHLELFSSHENIWQINLTVIERSLLKASPSSSILHQNAPSHLSSIAYLLGRGV
jgi:hypothetical protein